MGKETSSSSNKRRKPSTTEQEVDLYKKIIEYEEKEALERESVDEKLFFTAIIDLYKYSQELNEMLANPKKDKQVILNKQRQLNLLIVGLKRVNRSTKFRLKANREDLNREKQKFDSIHLRLQNLLYEDAHLLSEIDKCLQYKSKDEELEIISEEEFLKTGPKDLISAYKNKQRDTKSKHQLHLGRLEYELRRRKEMAELCTTSKTEMMQMSKTIVEKQHKLAKLAPHLRDLLIATKPLQEELDIPIEKLRLENKVANLLPNQLYLIYCYGNAFKEVSPGIDLGFKLEILGDPDEAVQYKELAKLSDLGSDIDTDAVEEPVESKKRRHRKIVQVDKNEEKRKKLLEAHPLSISLSVFNKDGAELKIKFQYRPQLKLITVTSTADIPSYITASSAREVINGESILNELFDGDYGIDSPRLSNKYIFRKLNIGSYQSLIPKLGYAYIWAQKLAGLDYLETSKRDKKDEPEMHIEVVLNAIKTRFMCRVGLAMQLQQLEQNIIPAIPENIEHPKISVSELTKFTSTTYAKFCEITPQALSLVDSDMVNSQDLFYNLTISRQKAVLSASLVIKNDYPMKAPMFILYTDNGKINAENSDDLRDMERAVNNELVGHAKNASWLLALRLKFLCAYFDVYTETMANPNVPRSTVFFKKIGGRNRSRPFRFQDVGNGDLSVFVQY